MDIDDVLTKNNTEQCIIYKDRIVYDFMKNHKLIQLKSITKLFVSMTIGILYDAGKLKLSDSIDMFIKDFPYPNITIFHVLTHTSGLEYKWNKITSNKFFKSDLDNFVLNLKKVNKLGTFRYNNYTPNILTWIIRIITNMDVDEFLDHSLFKKLDIKYKWIKNKGKCYGAFGLYMNADDLLKIGKILIDKKNAFISKKYLQMMSTEHYKKYGLFTMCKYNLFGHDGSGGQYFFYNPKKKIILIRLIDSDNSEYEYSEFLENSLKLLE